MTSADSARQEGLSARPDAATLELRHVTKRYAGQAEAAVEDLSPRGAGRRDLRPGGALGLRQDHRDADGQPDDRHHRGRHPARRAERQGAPARRAAARDRLRDPADRPLPPPHRRRQHRHGPQAARLGAGANPRAHRRAARARLARPRRDARPLPGPAVGRAAPAGRRGPCPGRRPAADAHGRALRRHRPDQPRAAPERVPPPPARDPQDDRLRDPRHRRGDQDGRPHRDHAEGRQARPVRDAGRAALAPGQQVRRGLRGRGPGAEAPRPPAGARREPLEGAAGAGGRAGGGRPTQARGVRGAVLPARRRRPPPARLVVRARARWRARGT